MCPRQPAGCKAAPSGPFTRSAVSVATAVCYMAYVVRVDGARGPAYQLGFNALALLSMWGFAAFLEWKERRQAETRRPAGAKARTADMPSASAGALT